MVTGRRLLLFFKKREVYCNCINAIYLGTINIFSLTIWLDGWMIMFTKYVDMKSRVGVSQRQQFELAIA
jgi:hypothetical protein